MKTTDMQVAETILAQLGGGRFVTMTGAKYLVGDVNRLAFQLPRGAKDGINAVDVTLDPSDTYTVRFRKIGTARSGYRCTEIASVSDVYAEDLRDIFTAHTGLYTSL